MSLNDSNQREPALSATDEAAVDALVEHGFDLDAARTAHPELADRIVAVHALVSTTDAYPAEPPDASLVDATLARIDRAEDERAARMAVGNTPAPRIGRGRWSDFIAIACVAILALSVGLPLLHQFRMRGATLRCESNLRQLHAGLDGYYADFQSRPFAAGLGPDISRLASWGSYDNSRHLDVLQQANYCGQHCLCCGNDTDRSGYASQVPSRHSDPLWAAHANLPLIADRNPLVFQTAFGGRASVATVENSPDHGREGQNVLYGDGSVRFERSPMLMIRRSAEGKMVFENIWVPADGSGDEGRFHDPRAWGSIDIFLMQ